jgi:hypothetical protein
VSRHAALFDKAFPMRGLAVRRWLRDPIGGMAGLWFVSGINGRSAIQARGGRERVRERVRASRLAESRPNR